MSEPQTLPALLADRARRLKGQAALVALPGIEGPEQVLTYDQIEADATALAAALQQRLPLGGRVLLVLPNEADFVRLFWACVLAGLVAVPVAVPRNARGLERIDALARVAGAALVIHSDAFTFSLAKFRQTAPLAAGAGEWVAARDVTPSGGFVTPDLSPNMTAVLQFTSGSTGMQKGVMVRHRNILANAECLTSVCGRGMGMRMVSWLPFFHDWGLIGCLVLPIFAEGTGWFFDPADFLRRPRRWIELISEKQASLACAPDFAYRLATTVADDGPQLDLSHWTMAMLGAEPIRAETLTAFATAYAPHGFAPGALYPSYGLAENTLIATGGPPGVPFRQSPLGRQTFTNCGAPLLGQRIAIVDPETGLQADDGEVGELWITGESVAAGYWANPEATEATFHARLPGDSARWLRTGDLAFLVGGDLHVCGRMKDVVIKAGENHLAEDLERAMEAADPALRIGCGAAFGIEAAGAERMVLVQEVNYGPKPDLPRLIGAIQRAISQSNGVMADAIAILPPGRLEKTSSGKIRRAHTRDLFVAGKLEPLLLWQGWQNDI